MKKCDFAVFCKQLLVVIMPLMFLGIISCTQEDSNENIHPEVSVPDGYINYFIEDLFFDCSASETKIAFQINEKWVMKVVFPYGESTSWCNVDVDSGDAGLHKVVVRVTDNETGDSRTARIHLICGESKVAEIVVNQDYGYTIQLKCKDYSVSYEDTIIDVELKTNIPFEYRILGTSWIREYQPVSRTLNTHKLFFEVEGTISDKPREAQIIFYNSECNVADTLRLMQEGNPYGWASADNINRNPSGYAQRLEMPRLDDNNLYNCYTTSYNGKETVTFSIEYDSEKRHSKWVAYTFDKSTAQINWNRNDWESTTWEGDPFQPDPLLPENVRIGDKEHLNDQYDRGHLCASADRLYSKDANEQTFYYSNISPQLGVFNTGIWLDLENKVQNWGSNPNMRDTLYIVKGGTIRDGEFYDSRGQHGTIVTDFSKMSGIVVPAHYFMALICRKNDTFYGIGFYFEHKSHRNGSSLGQYAITIDELEEYTGIDFFCNFPDKVEEAIESKCTPSLWGL